MSEVRSSILWKPSPFSCSYRSSLLLMTLFVGAVMKIGYDVLLHGAFRKHKLPEVL